jgi:hypothetical protein
MNTEKISGEIIQNDELCSDLYSSKRSFKKR